VKIFTIGIVDFGFGNHASVVHSLRDLDFRVRVSNRSEDLDMLDALVLPGVGAFPVAMHALGKQGLTSYLQKQAARGRPIVGICLGMQLLASASFEHKHTAGLDLIPGEIVPFPEDDVHIGWNSLDFIDKNSSLASCDGSRFYFNHSYYYRGPAKYEIAMTSHHRSIAAIIRSDNVVGLQFHPEKSQASGRKLLKNLILELVDA